MRARALLVVAIATGCHQIVGIEPLRAVADGGAVDGGAADRAAPTEGGSPDGAVPPDASSSELVCIDADALCTRITVTCARTGDAGITRDDCLAGYSVQKFTKACADAFSAASCADLLADPTPFFATCFPPCTSAGKQTCNGDGTLTAC